MGKTLGVTGAVVSVIYLGLIGWMVWGDWAAFHSLKLNELGDFLAGTFGPLAILWLILGFFQQGIELRQNSEALHLQAKELANSVEQQRAMVQVARDQYESDKQSLQLQIDNLEQEREKQKRISRPKFALTTGGSHSTESAHNINLNNYGQSCTEVRITLENSSYKFSPDYFPLIKMGASPVANLVLPRTPPFDEDVMKVEFIDISGLPGELRYRLTFIKGDTYSALKLNLIE